MSLSRSDAIGLVSGLFGALAIMVVVTPGEAIAKLGDWSYVLAGAGAGLLLWSAYQFGHRNGMKSAQLISHKLPEILSIDDLIYATNQIATLVLEEGALPDGLETYTPRVHRDHPVWHNDPARLARDAYLAIVKSAVKSRFENTPSTMWMAGGGALDFKPDDRLRFSGAVTQRRDELIAALSANSTRSRKVWWKKIS